MLRVNLSDAILDNCNLSGARLNRAYMAGATLKNSDLTSADLSGSNALYVDFSNAILQEACLIRAYLSSANLNNVDLNHAILNGTNLTRVSFDTANVIGAVFESNLGLSERQKSELFERGASILPSPPNPNPLFPNDENLAVLSLGEAKGDLRYRFLDLEESLQALLEIIDILKQERDVLNLELEYKRFQKAIEDEQKALFEELETIANGDIQEWLSQEFTVELDNLHRQICTLSFRTYTAHSVWTGLLSEETSAPHSNPEEF